MFMEWVVVLALAAFVQIDQTKTAEEQIAEVLSALPASMRAEATVKGYDPSGNLLVLREGGSEIVCRADDPTVRAWVVACYPKAIEAFIERSQALTKEGKETPARLRTLVEEIESGALSIPPAAAVYTRSGNTVDDATGVLVLYVPGATGKTTGLPTLPVPGSPWLSESGTPIANIRISLP